jgi:GAF domain-containing protein
MSDERPTPAGSARDRALDALLAVAVRLRAADAVAPSTAEPALRAVAEAAAAVVRVTAASVALVDPASGRLVFRAAAGPEGRGVVGLSIAAHEGIAGYVYSTGQALAIADVVADPRFERTTAERTGYVPRSLLAVPLVDEVGIAGVMEFLDRRDGAPFDLVDVEVASRMAAATTAVARASHVDRDAGELLRTVVTALVDGDDGPLEEADIEALIAEVADRLAGDDPVWRLADRIGRLRAADPDDIELAVAWLDALLERTERRTGSAHRRRA